MFSPPPPYRQPRFILFQERVQDRLSDTSFVTIFTFKEVVKRDYFSTVRTFFFFLLVCEFNVLKEGFNSEKRERTALDWLNMKRVA